MLLGTAGTGKTCAMKTMLQTLLRRLYDVGLPSTLVRVAAQTGSAAFNVRFNATTVHRLIHWFNLRVFGELDHPDRLADLQNHLDQTELIALDEISMVGRQMMGRIDSRCQQAKPGAPNPDCYSLGGVSLVCVGDPAQIQAIGDQQMYDLDPHPDTATKAMAQTVQLSNTGREIYAEFDKVIVLQKGASPRLH